MRKILVLALIFIGLSLPSFADYTSDVTGSNCELVEKYKFDCKELAIKLFNGNEHDWGPYLEKRNVKFTKIKTIEDGYIIFFRINWAYTDRGGIFSTGKYVSHTQMRKAKLLDYGEGLTVASNYPL